MRYVLYNTQTEKCMGIEKSGYWAEVEIHNAKVFDDANLAKSYLNTFRNEYLEVREILYMLKP